MERTQDMTNASAPTVSTEGSYIDWAAILAGAAIAAALAALATGFGAALGLSAVSVEPGEGSGTLALVIGAIWTVVSMVACYAAGGYIAGRMRRRVESTAKADEVSVRDGMNGLAVWAVGTIVSLMVLSGAAGNVLSAAGSAAGTAVTAAGSAAGGLAEVAVAAAAGTVSSDDASATMSFVTDSLFRSPPAPGSTTAADPADTTRQAGSILANLATTGVISDADRAYLTQAVAAQTGLAPAEVDARVTAAVESAQKARADAEAALEAAKQQAIDAAETARISAVLTGFILTATSLVALATAMVCAVRGGLHRDEGRAYAGLTVRR